MAGMRNQRRLAVLQRLRDRADRQDEAIRAWQRSTDSVRAAESEMEDLRSDYETSLAAITAKRADAVKRSAQLLATVAALFGDDNNIARLLDVSRHQVHDARTLEHADNLVEATDL